jgi:hypothetical protein
MASLLQSSAMSTIRHPLSITTLPISSSVYCMRAFSVVAAPRRRLQERTSIFRFLSGLILSVKISFLFI